MTILRERLPLMIICRRRDCSPSPVNIIALLRKSLVTDFQETEASSCGWVRLVVQSGRSINKSPLLMLFIHQHHHQLRRIPDSDVAYPPPRLLLIHLNEGKSIVMIMFYLEKLFAIKIVGALMFVYRSFSFFYLNKK